MLESEFTSCYGDQQLEIIKGPTTEISKQSEIFENFIKAPLTPAETAIKARNRMHRRSIKFCDQLQSLLNDTNSKLYRDIISHAKQGKRILYIKYYKYDKYIPQVETVAEKSFLGMKYSSTELQKCPSYIILGKRSDSKLNYVAVEIFKKELITKFPSIETSTYKIRWFSKSENDCGISIEF